VRLRRSLRIVLLSLVTASLVISCAAGDGEAVAEAGTVFLDATHVEGIRPLRGVWEVYPGEALAPDALRDRELRRYAAMPPRYGRYYTADGIRLLAGEITYRLVFENAPSAPLLGVLLPPMYGTCPAWVNGVAIGGRVVPLVPDGDGRAELVLRTDHRHIPFGGLASRPVSIGPVGVLSSHGMVQLLRDGFLIGALVVLGISSLFLTFGPNRGAPTVTFATLVFSLAIRLLLLDGEGSFLLMVSLPVTWSVRLIGLAMYPTAALLLRFARSMYPLETKGRWELSVERIIWFVLAVSLVIPVRWWMDLLYAALVVFVVATVLLVRVVVRALRSRRDGAVWMAVAVAAGAVAAIADLARTTQILPIDRPLMGYGFLFFAGFASVALFLRVVDFRISLEHLQEQAQHDGLTGLYNRRVLDTRVQEEYLRHIREGRPLGLIMLDVDFFKGYNDALGHQAGDEVLRVIAAVLDDHARRGGDIAARYGGEEFALVLPNTDVHGAYRVAEEIRRSVEEQGLNHPMAPTGILTASLGVAVFLPWEGRPSRRSARLPERSLPAASAPGRYSAFSTPSSCHICTSPSSGSPR
jgi:diguanylate cyclase (GGDEF)-like protein